MSPTRTAEKTDRFDVTSSDGTRIAVWVEGDRPPLVMVHGSLQDHTASGAIIEVLRADLTTFAMDRRGFGKRGDRAEYAFEREFEDVAAVVDAVAERVGGPVALWGHSYGASCAMGGTGPSYARSAYTSSAISRRPCRSENCTSARRTSSG